VSGCMCRATKTRSAAASSGPQRALFAVELEGGLRNEEWKRTQNDFVKQWNEKGGDQLEKEANDMLKQVKK
jgi:hypothetical protein